MLLINNVVTYFMMVLNNAQSCKLKQEYMLYFLIKKYAAMSIFLKIKLKYFHQICLTIQIILVRKLLMELNIINGLKILIRLECFLPIQINLTKEFGEKCNLEIQIKVMLLIQIFGQDLILKSIVKPFLMLPSTVLIKINAPSQLKS